MRKLTANISACWNSARQPLFATYLKNIRVLNPLELVEELAAQGSVEVILQPSKPDRKDEGEDSARLSN